MLIRVTGRAEVTLEDGGPITSKWILHELHGAESEGACADYLCSKLADLGLTGGTVKLLYDSDENGFQVRSAYTAPNALKPEELQSLAEETAGQWSDGIGEGCFYDLEQRLGVNIDLRPPGRGKVHIEQIDDGTMPAPPKTALATAAREGDVTTLRRLLDAGADTETRLQSYTPLHLAIIYGRTEAALELIRRGADIHARDPQDKDPLLLCALSNGITDVEAARVARALLEGGVSVHGPHGPHSNPENTPLFLANLRKKSDLAAILNEFGANAPGEI